MKNYKLMLAGSNMSSAFNVFDFPDNLINLLKATPLVLDIHYYMNMDNGYRLEFALVSIPRTSENNIDDYSLDYRRAEIL